MWVECDEGAAAVLPELHGTGNSGVNPVQLAEMLTKAVLGLPSPTGTVVVDFLSAILVLFGNLLLFCISHLDGVHPSWYLLFLSFI